MGLFTDIYNTVAKFFRSQDATDGDASKSVATNRLKLVLMQDRTNLTPKVLEQMRGELVDLLSKYLEMDKELLELNFEQEGDQVALMLSIPVIRAKDEEEIEAALNAEKETEEETDNAEETTENDTDEEVENDETDESEETDDENSEEETVEENSESSEVEEVVKPKKRKLKKQEEQPETENSEENEVVEETTEE